MIYPIVIAVAMLIATIIVKKQWLAIVGMGVDVIMFAYLVILFIPVFTNDGASPAEQSLYALGFALGYAISMAILGPLIFFIGLIMLGLMIWQAILIGQYDPKRMAQKELQTRQMYYEQAQRGYYPNSQHTYAPQNLQTNYTYSQPIDYWDRKNAELQQGKLLCRCPFCGWTAQDNRMEYHFCPSCGRPILEHER